MKWKVDELEKFKTKKKIVKIRTRYDESNYSCYIIDWSDEWLVTKTISGDILSDGYTVFQRTGIKNIKQSKAEKFVSDALKLRKEKWPKISPRIKKNLDKPGDIIQAVLKSFPLVTLHFERWDPDVCFIGRDVKIKGNYLKWYGIDPNAEMKKEAFEFKLNKITKIQFGDQYSNALWQVYQSRH